MANKKKAWAAEDETHQTFDFPKLTASQIFIPPTNENVISGDVRNRKKPTGTYKYRCPDCGENYHAEAHHECKTP